MPFFWVFYASKGRYAIWCDKCSGNSRSPGGLPAQQPRQMFLSRAFISASSALIVSTYFALSTFEGLTAGFSAAVLSAGFAAGTALWADGAGGAALS
jgi:hypothetical protein